MKSIVVLFLLLSATPIWALLDEADSSLEEISECLLDKNRYEFLEQDKIECNGNYLLFQSPKRSKVPAQLKIGSFNIIRMGTDSSVFKRYDIVADIINQWDLVGVVEIMATPAAYIEKNRKIDLVAAQLQIHQRKYSALQKKQYAGILNDSYEMPGYLKLLMALRELDPSWSLILGPRATGSTVTSREMGGFYYRAGAVTNIKSSFCGGERGCAVAIPEKVASLVPRLPFSATFKAGSLRFNAVALHLRFRENPPECKAGERASEDEKEPRCAIFSTEAKTWMNEFKDVVRTKPRGRFIELAIISDQLKNSTDDVMLMGDFNLPYVAGSGRTSNDIYWSRALNNDGKKIFVHEKTSLSRQYGLSGEYDHFIYDPQKIKGCDSTTAKAYSFLLNLKNPVTEEQPLQKISDFLLNRKENAEAILAEYAEGLALKQQLQSCSETGCVTSPLLNERAQQNLIELYKNRIVYTKSTIPYKIYEDMISDHIPITMNCKTSNLL